MLSFTEMQTLYQNLINDTSANALTVGNTYINLTYKNILNSRNWDFTEKLYTFTTVAQQQEYDFPNDYRKINAVTLQVGAVKYVLRECPSRKYWEQLNQVRLTSNFAQWYYVYNGKINIWPLPSQTGLTCYLDYKINTKDLTLSDYTTGTITTLANNSVTVTGFGSTWTSAMSERWLKLNESSGGDGNWYKIAKTGKMISVAINNGGTGYVVGNISYITGGTAQVLITTVSSGIVTGVSLIDNGSGYISGTGTATTNFSGSGTGLTLNTTAAAITATQLYLDKPYQGDSISAGSVTYQIGQLSILPEGYQELPVYGACKMWAIQRDVEKFNFFKGLHDELYEAMKIDRSSKNTMPNIEDTSEPQINPNLTISAT